jgi:glycosyltransferase involved in cell wall biosynthesis
MILIDSVFIHTGGGLTILKYLIEKLAKQKDDIFYLLDSRFLIPESLKNNIVHYQFANGFLERYAFYKKNCNFKTIFCIGNLAPPISTSSKVITYLHSDWYVAKPIVKNPKKRFLLFIKRLIFQHYVHKSNYFIVQTQSMKKKFLLNNQFKNENVFIYPIFDIPIKNLTAPKDPNSYIYVSEGYFHKNHFALLDAFNQYSKINPSAKLYITVKNDIFPEIKNKLDMLNNFNIINIGFVPKEELENFYIKSNFLIFPSKQECFGLGLVEAINYKCNIIASDLDYVYDICKPSITFNPYDTQSIYDALVLSKDYKNITPSEIKTSSKIYEVLDLILN